MRRVKVLWGTLLAGVTLFLAGCQSAQVEHDGVDFRHALLDMYTEQALDNVIRAREGLPFVQVSYRNLLVQDTDMLSGGASAGWSESSSHSRAAGATLMSASRMFGHMFGLTSSASRSKIMSFYADPVTTDNEVYLAYLAFAADPNLLIVSDERPNCDVVCQKKCGHKYFWVPIEAGPAFQELLLKTSLMRGPETAPPGAYEVMVTGVSEPKLTGKGDSVVSTLTFSASVPNSLALMLFKIDGRTVKIPLTPVFTTEEGKPVDDGVPTTRLEAQWSPKLRGASADDLKNKKVRVYSYLYPPEAAVPSPIPQQVLDELNRIRANQALFPGTP
jgi:hypothetical protein